MGILYIVATPIGNLQDITLRAIQTLKNTDFIACEDTRSAFVLLASFGFKKEEFKDKLLSFYEGNEHLRHESVLNLLQSGQNVALISESGTPLISDPGFKLVRSALERGVKVESIPGPSSTISSLVSSGLPTDKFLFIGFLPKKLGHRLTLFKNLKESLKLIESTVMFFESPFRLLKTLEELKKEFGDIEVVITRELTKIHEEVKKDRISNLLEFYKKGIKGEIVVLFSLK
jgi:16S rRNA (cytidine1402-2'-O)-methyltransferase